MLSFLLLLLLLSSSFLLLLLQCAYLYIYLFTEACSDKRFAKIVNDLWLLTIFTKALSRMLHWVVNVFEIIPFILFVNYSLISFSIDWFTFYSLISVYVSRVYILAASCYYSHVLACVINKFVYEDFCKNIFNLLEELSKTIYRNTF